jgi:hypothetical protein
MSDFKKRGEEYLFTPAAVLVMASDAIHSRDTGLAGKIRGKLIVEEVIAAARAAKFEQADVLETLLLSGAPGTRLLPICRALTARIGGEAFTAALRRAGLNLQPFGGQS